MSTITIQVAGQTFTLTPEQAHALHKELCAIFGEAPRQRNVPFDPNPFQYPPPPQWPYDIINVCQSTTSIPPYSPMGPQG